MNRVSSGSVTNSSPNSGYFRLIFLPLCVLAIEVAFFLSLQPLVGLFGSNDGATTRVGQIVAAADAAAVWIHNLIKSFVVGGLVWILLFGRELYQTRNESLAISRDTNVARPFAQLCWAIHLISLLALTFFRSKLNGYGGSEPLVFSSAVMTIGYATTFLAFALSGLRLWAPFHFWRSYFATRRARIAAIAACSFALAVGWNLGLRLNDIEPRYVELFFKPTADIASSLLELWGYKVQIDAPNQKITVDGFTVIVGSPCLGYEGMAVAFAVLIIYVYVNKTTLRMPQAFLIVPATFLALFVGNCIRVAVLLAIGVSWSVDVAVKGFHSVAGSINLFLILMLAILALNLIPFFSRKPRGFAFDLSEEKSQLLPLVALIAVAMLSLLISPGFEWLYPIRVAVVGASLLALWPRLGLSKISRDHLPVVVGIGVFALWLMLVPEDPEQSAQFAKTLFSAPTWLAVAWIVVRIIGAAVIVPLAEELAFRGYLFKLIESSPMLRGKLDTPHKRQALALLATSIGFALLHSAWLAAILAGLAYGLLRLYRDRVMDAVIAHAVTNLLLAGYVIAFQAWSLW